ncbi:MAG TPA: type II toxin-antitoxin system RelE/ParE family toxin [Candidatus Hydrogenedentes bacterium]|nr:type II toxin-antitoxin system RelE/ParE family toxin [Candidatus Hydrogenedentota bacterium]HNT88862.1 type II toxin-antitoxin system RelE/ParE family toxin [Candidatus Hydrogenedentota bacterium]
MPKRDRGASFEFRIFETDEFRRRLERLSKAASEFLQRKLRRYVYPQLRENPFLGPNIKKLKGYAPDTWRYRIGDFRIFFTVDRTKRIVFLLTLDDRRDAYR